MTRAHRSIGRNAAIIGREDKLKQLRAMRDAMLTASHTMPYLRSQQAAARNADAITWALQQLEDKPRERE
jgi:hypothetical protein